MYPLLFQANLHELVWGGHKLRALKGLAPNQQPIGESWEISDVPSSESHVRNGRLTGRSIHSLINEYGAVLLGNHIMERYGAQLPLLVKFIDAAQDLSIQVHPNDELAHERHGSLGKTEMWYVMQADPGASMLVGFKEQITKDDYAHRVEDGTIVDVLARHERGIVGDANLCGHVLGADQDPTDVNELCHGTPPVKRSYGLIVVKWRLTCADCRNTHTGELVAPVPAYPSDCLASVSSDIGATTRSIDRRLPRIDCTLN